MNHPQAHSPAHDHSHPIGSPNILNQLTTPICRILFLSLLLLTISSPNLHSQIDPNHRSMLQLGYDQPIDSRGPQGLYAYYYYNNPHIAGTNTTLRLAIAPAYIDGELGFKELISPTTDVGIGLYGGVFGDNYYEVRQGHYHRTDSFDGHGGGTALSIYQKLNPGMLIPLNLVGRAGFRYSVYAQTTETAPNFELPDSKAMPYTRVGLRLAGKEPVLYPELGFEVSAWFERQWRLESSSFGYNHDRSMSDRSDLYWLYAGIDYAWTNSGNRVSFAITAGGSSDTDRFSAWRLGGVLPLVAEFPLILPGYYYQELTAESFVHLYASYLFPLDPSGRFQFRIEAASANLNYLSGFEQPGSWQTDVGCGISFTPTSKSYRIVARYGYGINAIRNDNDEGGHSIGLLVQYDFEQRKHSRSAPQP